MSREVLLEVRERAALGRTRHYETLEAVHVPFDELVGGQRVEATITRLSQQQGPLALIGQSGTGKTSALSFTLGQLSETVPPWLVPLHVPMIVDPSQVTSVTGFVSHIVRYVVDWAAADRLGEREREDMESRVADLSRRSGRSRRFGFALHLPLAMVVPGSALGLQGDIGAARDEWEQGADGRRGLARLTDLVAIFRAREVEPFFVLDDTDRWLHSVFGPQSDELVRGFAANLRGMVETIDCGVAVQLHTEYLRLPAVVEVMRFLTPVELPQLPRPVDNLGRILSRRLEVAEVPGDLNEVFSVAALDYLAACYQERPDLRIIIMLADEAVSLALDDDSAELVGEPAVRAAQAVRRGLMT